MVSVRIICLLNTFATSCVIFTDLAAYYCFRAELAYAFLNKKLFRFTLSTLVIPRTVLAVIIEGRAEFALGCIVQIIVKLHAFGASCFGRTLQTAYHLFATSQAFSLVLNILIGLAFCAVS